jgi:hypothetical protein
MRSFVYADWIGRQRRASYDRETLYVATVFHDLGLTSLAPVRGASRSKAPTPRRRSSPNTVPTSECRPRLRYTRPPKSAAQVPRSRSASRYRLRRPASRATTIRDRRGAHGSTWLGLTRRLNDLVGLYRRIRWRVPPTPLPMPARRHVEGFRRFNFCDALVSRARSLRS